MAFDIVATKTILKQLFPQVYQEEAEGLIAFLEAYYTWLEGSEYGQAKNLLAYRDVDTTLDEFVIHFKNKYISNLPTFTRGNIREFIKHSDDFYDVRGTEEGVRLLFSLLYDTKAKVYKPSADIIKPSDGEWYKPVYLEISLSDKNIDLVGKEIIGASSQAKAYVETVIRKMAGGQYFDVMYISNVRGNFETGERVSDDEIENAPIVIGSLNRIDILDGGRDNAVGDLFEVVSSTGRQGLARIVEVFNGTGRVDFELVEGGTGYSVNAQSIISNSVFTIGTVVGEGFRTFETVEQLLSNVSFLSANSTFAVGDTVKGYTSGTFVEQASGRVISVSQTGANGSMLVALANSYSEFVFADTLRKAGNTISAVIDTVTNKTATANVVASTSNALGVFSILNTFQANVNIRGRQSNTTANIVAFSQGTGANFTVGSITNDETVLVASDYINGVNDANVPYLHIKLNGEGSGVGFVDSVTINSGGTGYTNGAALTYVGGGQTISAITINVAGTGYANGDRLVFTSNTGIGASATLTTNSIGAIVSFTIANTGLYYSTPPVITINTVAGTSADLTAVLNHTNHANGTVTTDGAGVIVSTTGSPGSGYFYTPTITVAGGTGANLVAVMDYGYGFPKNPDGANVDIIGALLTRESMTIGTIATLSNLAPGSNYNRDPFVKVIEPRVASASKRNLVLSLANVVGSFIEGEVVNQGFNANLVQLTYTGIAGNTNFEIGEVVTQGAANGIVYYRDASIVRLANTNGTFVNTSNGTTIISGAVTVATANVANVASYTQALIVRGVVDSFSNTTLVIKRLSFNTDINANTTITGITSDAAATVVSYADDYASSVMGDNALITATVRTANGIASAVEVIDSGFGYRQDDVVSLTSANNAFVVSGVAVLEKQGHGKGSWKSTRGFLNSDKYIHDGRYYQAFSYEIQTSLSFDYYADVVKKLLHIAGTEVFGKTVIESNTNITTAIVSSSITQT